MLHESRIGAAGSLLTCLERLQAILESLEMTENGQARIESLLNEICRVSKGLRVHLSETFPSSSELDSCLRINQSLYQLAEDCSRHSEALQDQTTAQRTGQAIQRVIVSLLNATRLLLQDQHLQTIQKDPSLTQMERLEHLVALSNDRLPQHSNRYQ